MGLSLHHHSKLLTHQHAFSDHTSKTVDHTLLPATRYGLVAVEDVGRGPRSSSLQQQCRQHHITTTTKFEFGFRNSEFGVSVIIVVVVVATPKRRPGQAGRPT